MGRGRRSSVQARQFWLGHVESQRSSRVSVPEYCREAGLSAASFYVWRSRLSREASEQAPQGFREVASSTVAEPGAAVDVVAVRIRMSDMSQLSEVLRTLGQL
jgi:hypothetical protein